MAPLVNCSWLWFTYAQWPDCPDAHAFHLKFEHLPVNRNADFEIAVCQEDHANGGLHIHALVFYPTRLRFRSCDPAAEFTIDRIRPKLVFCNAKEASGRKYIHNCHGYVHKVTGHQCEVHERVKCTLASSLPAVRGEGSREVLKQAILDSCDANELWAKCKQADPVWTVQNASSIATYADIHLQQVRDDGSDGPSYSQASWVLPEPLLQWQSENLGEHPPARPTSILIASNSRFGKTEWARSLGPHIYWGGAVVEMDLKMACNAMYIVVDDLPEDEMKLFLRRYWKSILGCQRTISVNPKYGRKFTVNWAKPCIFLTNELVYWPDQRWAERNVREVILERPLF